MIRNILWWVFLCSLLVSCQPKPILPTLDHTNVKETVEEALAEMQECFLKYKIPGLVDIRFTVLGESGKVASVKVVGKFEGTPTGECIENIILNLRFQAFKEESADQSYSLIFK